VVDLSLPKSSKWWIRSWFDASDEVDDLADELDDAVDEVSIVPAVSASNDDVTEPEFVVDFT